MVQDIGLFPCGNIQLAEVDDAEAFAAAASSSYESALRLRIEADDRSA
jgi:hypothetical protein